MSDKQYAYSEIFHSIQGEGKYTGVPTAWLRFFLCNLQCDGFGQKDPTDPSTYVLPYKTIELKDVKRLEDLPVFEHGCDTSYSWSAKYKHLQHKDTARGIYDKIKEHMKSPYNPGGLFAQPGHSEVVQHMCFTGGEPLMKHAQACVLELIEIFNDEADVPESITWETNSTQILTPAFREMLRDDGLSRGFEAFCSASPKLFSVSGEKNAIDVDNLADYYFSFDAGQLKFVINGTPESWAELDAILPKIREAGNLWPVYIMPIGATLEGQKGQLEGHMGAAAIATEAFKRGYNVSARVHVDLWGNLIGV